MKKKNEVHGDGSEPSVNPQPENALPAMAAFLNEAETVKGTLDDLIIEAFDDGEKGRLYILRFQVGRLVEAGRALVSGPASAAPVESSDEKGLADRTKAHWDLYKVCNEAADLLVGVSDLLAFQIEGVAGWPGHGVGFMSLAGTTAKRLIACKETAWQENLENAGKGGGR